MRPFLLATLMISTAATAQPHPPGQPPRTDLSRHDDEFSGAALDAKWTRFDQRYGWPDKLKRLDVGATVPGALHLQPYHGAWVRDLNAPFLFQTIDGDFDVRARVRVRGASGAIPGGTWSLGGLMARTPNGLDAASWEPRRENWHFVTTGAGLERGVPVTETKGTYNSFSSLKLRPFRSGWVELRLVRVGMTLFALAREEGGAWRVRDRFYRMEPNPVMQVGLIAYTTSDAVPPQREDPVRENKTVLADAPVDMLMDVDWIRFRRPAPAIDWKWQTQVREHPLADPNLSEAEILAALGS
ncbi:hypothetical protein [Sphingomonas sp.]|uniref:hypothetical protein n=1 Tax=Sphingomonas sp. TaxID=28214 RepID=UPI002DE8269F|nr:hypothetical protein [Sphingomonas sp.]